MADQVPFEAGPRARRPFETFLDPVFSEVALTGRRSRADCVRLERFRDGEQRDVVRGAVRPNGGCCNLAPNRVEIRRMSAPGGMVT
jgi:hypothetical protein